MKSLRVAALSVPILLIGCANQQAYMPPADGPIATVIVDGEGAVPNYAFFTNEECKDPQRVPTDSSGKATFKVRSGQPISVVWLYSMTKSTETGKNSWCEAAYTFWPEAHTYRLTVLRTTDTCWVQVHDADAMHTDLQKIRYVKKAYSRAMLPGGSFCKASAQ